MKILNYIANNLFLLPPFFFLFFLIFRQWKFGVILIFIWLYFQDIIRKILPGQPPFIMLVTDIFVFVTYFSFFFWWVLKNKKERLKLWRPPFLAVFIVFVLWCLVESFNPVLPNIFFPLVGFRAYFWYVPLLLCGYYMFEKKKNLMKFSRFLVYTSIPLVLFLFFQRYFGGFFSVLLKPFEKAHSFHSFPGSPIPLASSVFGSADRFARQVFFLALLGVGTLLYPKNNIKQKIFIIISTIFAILGVFISGRRAPIFLLGLAAFSFFLFSLKKLHKVEFLKILIILISLAFFFLMLVSTYFPHVNQFIFYSFSKEEVFLKRACVLFEDFRLAVENAGFWGAGTGSRSQGINYIPGGGSWQEGIPKERFEGLSILNAKKLPYGPEGGLAKVWYELGPVGGIIFFILLLSMVFSWLKELSYLEKSPLFFFGFCLFLFLILMIPWFLKGHQIFGDTMTLVYFWFFMGVLFSLRKYESVSNFK